MMLASRLLLAVCLCVALCDHRAQSVFVSIVGNTNDILDLECREGGAISNAVFHITNLGTNNTITVQQDRYTLNIENDSRIRCSIMAGSEQSSPIQFAAVPDDRRTDMERYCAYEGQPVFLKCPYRRGPIGEYYSIQWLNVSPDFLVPDILDSSDVLIDNTAFDATTVSDAPPEIDYACELTLNGICNGSNSNCGNTVRRRGPAINVTTYTPLNITQRPTNETIDQRNRTSLICSASGHDDNEISISWTINDMEITDDGFECEDDVMSNCFSLSDNSRTSTLNIDATMLNSGVNRIGCRATQEIVGGDCRNELEGQFQRSTSLTAEAFVIVTGISTGTTTPPPDPTSPTVTPATNDNTTQPSIIVSTDPISIVGISVGASVGGVLAIVALALIVCCCVMCVCCPKRKKSKDLENPTYEEVVSPSCFQPAPNRFARQIGVPFDSLDSRPLYAELPYNVDSISGVAGPDSVYGGSQFSGHSSRSGGAYNNPYQGPTPPNISVLLSASASNLPGNNDPYMTMHPAAGMASEFVGPEHGRLSQASNVTGGSNNYDGYDPRMTPLNTVFPGSGIIPPPFPSPRQQLMDQTISSQLQLMVLDYLMHNENCQIPNCMCRSLKFRRQELVFQNPNYMPQRSAREFCQQEQRAADPRDRRHQLHLTLSNHNLHENYIHPHYHLSKNSHNIMTKSRRELLRVNQTRERSRSMSDLTPHEEETTSQLNTPAAMKSPFITRPTLGSDESDCGMIDVDIEKPPYLREISISADNIPALCVNDCPLTPSPLKAEYRVLGSPMRPKLTPWTRPMAKKSPLATVQERAVSVASTESNESNTSSRSLTSGLHGNEVAHSDNDTSTSDGDHPQHTSPSPSLSERRQNLKKTSRMESGYDTESEPNYSGKLKRRSREGSAGFEYPQQRTYTQQDSGVGGECERPDRRANSNQFKSGSGRGQRENGALLAQAYQLEEKGGKGIGLSPRLSSSSHVSLNSTQNETLV